jgi:flagellar basal body rod protein FlgG
MKEFHLHPDGQFLIREDGKITAYLDAHEIAQFAEITLPEGCTEVRLAADGVVYVTINKAMEGSSINPLATLISMEVQIREFHAAREASKASRAAELLS